MACAQALQDRGIESLQRSRAIARHLLASSQPTAALPYLRVAAYSMLQQADLAGAAQQLRRHEAISEICAGEQPEEQLSADLLRAQSALLEGRIQRARTLLVWSIGSSQRQRLSRLEAQAQLQIGQIDLRAGRPMAAWRHARRSVALLEEQPDRTLSAEQQLLHGRICLMSGRPTRSLLHLAQAHAWYAELEDSDLGIRVFQPLASLALSKGQLSLAQSHLDRAMAAHGSRFDGPERVLETELLQVQLHRHSGDTETAHAHLCRLEAESNPALGDGRLYIQLERILVDLELGHSPDFGVIQDLLVRSKKIGLGHTLTTLRALQLVSRSIQGENKEISEAILELAQARAQTGLWSIEDRRLVQRMIDTQRTSHRVPLCLLPLLESCLENRPPHNRRSLLLELSPEPCSR
jgi:hypothetical protein